MAEVLTPKGHFEINWPLGRGIATAAVLILIFTTVRLEKGDSTNFTMVFYEEKKAFSGSFKETEKNICFALYNCLSLHNTYLVLLNNFFVM